MKCLHLWTVFVYFNGHISLPQWVGLIIYGMCVLICTFRYTRVPCSNENLVFQQWKAPGPCTVRPRSATRIQHMTITLESTTKPRAGPRKLVSRARLMAVESGLAGPVLAGPVFGMAHAQKSNNDDHVCTNKCLLATSCAAFKT